MVECEEEWTSAVEYGILLPNCSDLPDQVTSECLTTTDTGVLNGKNVPSLKAIHDNTSFFLNIIHVLLTIILAESH